MKKKYWIINSNKKSNQYWIESIMIDPNIDNYQENKKEIYQLDSKINKLEYKKKKLNSQLLNTEIRDEKYI